MNVLPCRELNPSVSTKNDELMHALLQPRVSSGVKVLLCYSVGSLLFSYKIPLFQDSHSPWITGSFLRIEFPWGLMQGQEE